MHYLNCHVGGKEAEGANSAAVTHGTASVLATQGHPLTPP